jgi:hypothetical protein
MGASEGISQTLQLIVGATRRIRQSNISHAFLALTLVSAMSRSQRMPFFWATERISTAALGRWCAWYAISSVRAYSASQR